MRVRLTVAFVGLTFLAAGCGGSSIAHEAATQACIDDTAAGAEAAFLERAYREGRIGSAADVRHDVSTFEQAVPFRVTSFLRSDGTMIPWPRLSNDQQRTFEIWAHGTNIPEGVGDEAFRTLMRAKAAAKTTCKG
jgi:hypothetical protein